MDRDQFVYLLTWIQVANIVPQLVIAYLMLRWRSHSTRRWKRHAFLFVAANLIIFGMSRITITFFFDDFWLRLVVAGYSFVTGCMMAWLFWVFTLQVERRIAREEMRANYSDKSASDLTGAIVAELRSFGIDRMGS